MNLFTIASERRNQASAEQWVMIRTKDNERREAEKEADAQDALFRNLGRIK